MAPLTLENPFGIDPVRDLHHSPPAVDVPLWSENCLFQGYDSRHEVFFYHHLGRVAGDPNQWCGDFNLVLGDGRMLLAKNFGCVETATSMGDGNLSAECMEPLKSWRIRFKGVAFLSDKQLNRTRFVSVDLPPVPTEFDIRWEAIAPMHQVEGERSTALAAAEGGAHYEQGGVFRGFVRFGGTEIALAGSGYRDHSVGPRDLAKHSHHTWTAATFPGSRRVLTTLTLDDARMGYVVVDGQLHEAEVIEAPTWTKGDLDFPDQSFDVVVQANGRQEVMHGEMLPISYYWSIFAPSQLCTGMEPDRAVAEGHWTTKEAAVRYTWDGEETYGLLEISQTHGPAVDRSPGR